MNLIRIKHRQFYFLLSNQQTDFSATQSHTLRTIFFKFFNNCKIFLLLMVPLPDPRNDMGEVLNIECRTSIERYAQTVMKLIDRFFIKKEICGKQNTGKQFVIPGFLKKYIEELSPRLSPTAFLLALFFWHTYRSWIQCTMF